MNSIILSLRKIGLSDKASALYVTLLQHGKGTAAELSKETGIVRTTCYSLLEELRHQGLISVTKSGHKTLYIAETPKALQRIVEEKNSTIRTLVPILETLLEGNATRPKIQIHEGLEGVWRVYDDVIHGTDYEIRSFIPSDEAILVGGESKIKEYIRRRVKKNISVRAIMQRTPLIMREYAKFNKSDLREARFVDPKHFPMPVEINVYPPHNIAITSFQDALGLIIRSKPIFEALNTLFELSWISSSKK